MIEMNNVQIDIGGGYTLSISQFRIDGKDGATYSNREDGTVEIAILDPDANFVPLRPPGPDGRAEHDDVLGWVDFDGIVDAVNKVREDYNV